MTARDFVVRVSMLGCLVASLAQVSFADPPTGSGPPPGQPPGPPPEAITACAGKTAGTVVSFTLRDGHQVSGTCETVNGVLAARPTGGPGGH